ncbi:MAG TPA: hypothetical protein VGC15_16900 [Acetobacteraceae bacterium]
MARQTSFLLRAFVSGAAAAAASTAALALLARAEGQGALQPLNSTSHWLNGEQAASFKGADIAHTLTGAATHFAACVFWAALFEWRTGARGRLAPLPLLRDAVAVSAFAAVVDYTVTPKRFTPGWEFVLSYRSMAVVYAAMAAGLAGAALASQPRTQQQAGRHPGLRRLA